jgi:hypothetical protein
MQLPAEAPPPLTMPLGEAEPNLPSYHSSATPSFFNRPSTKGSLLASGKGLSTKQSPQPPASHKRSCSNAMATEAAAVSAVSKRKKKHQQLYLDLGQSNFAANTECLVCGMLFVHGLEEDAKRHRAVCQDYLRGVAFHFCSSKQQQLRVLRKWPLRFDKQVEAIQQQQHATIIEVRESFIGNVYYKRR